MAVAESLEALRAQLVEHLDEEETRALPLCAEHILAEEWGQPATRWRDIKATRSG
jgi:hypothetical protein